MTETTSAATAASPEAVRAALAESFAADLEGFMTGHEAAMGTTSVLATSPDAVPTTPPATTPAPAAPTAPLAGKYKSVEELEKGYWHVQNLLTRTQAELAATKGTPALESPPPGTPAPTAPAPAPLPAPRVNPVDRAKARAAEVLSKFSEKYTVEPDEMRDVVRAVSEEVLESRLAPMDRMAEAEEYMRANHPDALKFGTEIASYIAANPIVQKVVSQSLAAGEYEDAMEYAWERFQVASGKAAEIAGLSAAAVAEKAREAARVDAVAPTALTGSGVHPAAEAELSVEERQRLVDLYHAGYKTPLLRATIAKTLPDELFDPRFTGYGF